jgi:hypothetical protein
VTVFNKAYRRESTRKLMSSQRPNEWQKIIVNKDEDLCEE